MVDRGGGVNRYEILLKVELPGHYVGCVKYEGAVIGPMSLNIISLSGELGIIIIAIIILSLWRDMYIIINILYTLLLLFKM